MFNNIYIDTPRGHKMMIQQQARQNLQDKVQKWDPGHRDVQVGSLFDVNGDLEFLKHPKRANVNLYI